MEAAPHGVRTGSGNHLNDRALVIGYGSIGARHARVLAADLGLEVAVVSRRELDGVHHFPGVAAAVAGFAPHYAVVATETARHAETLRALDDAGFAGRVLVEKPLFGTSEGTYRPANPEVRVGFNLRFLPVLGELRRETAGESLLTVSARCGQWLPDWRPGRDYRTTSSALRAAGGGVLRDLSHELDLVTWIAGPWRRVAAAGGRVSELEIETEDLMMLLLECGDGVHAEIHLNYLDRDAERRVKVNTAAATWAANLRAGTLRRDADAARAVGGTVADTYLAQHRAVLAGDAAVCGFVQALDVDALIHAARVAARERRWVERAELP